MILFFVYFMERSVLCQIEERKRKKEKRKRDKSPRRP